MPERHACHHGVALITTMLVVVLLSLLIGALLLTVATGNGAAGSYGNQQLALEAARSGLAWLQARLETDCTSFAPAPDFTPPAIQQSHLTGGLDVEELGHNVVGVITPTGAATDVVLAFRASFNTRYNACQADPNWPIVVPVNLPPMTMLSLNNCRQPFNVSWSSYSNGQPYHQVRGAACDLIVEGLVMRSDGTVLGHRLVDCGLQVQDVSTLQQSAICSNGPVNLYETPTSVGGSSSATISVGSLASLDSMTVYGTQPGGGLAPPGYNQGVLSSMPVVSNVTYNTVNYTGLGTLSSPPGTGAPQSTTVSTSSYPGLTQSRPIPPPAVPITQLPALGLFGHPVVTVPAGTYVIWNGSLWHYPVDYPAFTNTSPPQYQSVETPGLWQSNGSNPPTLNVGGNGINPDRGPLNSLDGGNKIPFTPSSNTVTQSGVDLNVQPAGTASGFALVACPASQVPQGGCSTCAEMSFVADVNNESVQLRAPGNITIIGYAIGQGILATMDATAPGASISIVGRSNLDSVNDLGMAIYATGNVNILPIDSAQPPGGVASQIGTPGSVNYGVFDQAVALATLYALTTNPGGMGLVSLGPTMSWNNPNAPDAILSAMISLPYSIDKYQANQPVTLDTFLHDLAGCPGYGPLDEDIQNLIKQNYQQPGPGNFNAPAAELNAVGNAQPYPGYVPGSFQGDDPTAGAGGGNTGGSTGGGSGAVPPALCQTVAGAIYAYGNVLMYGDGVTVNGAIITYGGDPNALTPQPGQGAVNLFATQSIDITFNANDLALFSNLFQNRVVLLRQSEEQL
ncbi:MAG: hypothetical protein ACYCW6_04110 [Candidatus Xenobia bacterium]